MRADGSRVGLRGALRRAWRSRAARLLRRRLLELGVLSRTSPVSPSYGFERGQPVDRLYIERFLARHAADVRGRVLEVQDSVYATRFGGQDLTTVDVLDVDRRNAKATVHADLDRPGSVARARYDCVLLTQVLQFVEPEVALGTLFDALVPGGVLLVTAPAVGRVSGSTPGDRVRFLPAGLELALRRACPEAEVEVHAHGNVLASVAMLLGLAVEDLPRANLLRHDPRYPVLITARVRRPYGVPSPGPAA